MFLTCLVFATITTANVSTTATSIEPHPPLMENIFFVNAPPPDNASNYVAATKNQIARTRAHSNATKRSHPWERRRSDAGGSSQKHVTRQRSGAGLPHRSRKEEERYLRIWWCRRASRSPACSHEQVLDDRGTRGLKLTPEEAELLRAKKQARLADRFRMHTEWCKDANHVHSDLCLAFKHASSSYQGLRHRTRNVG